MRIILALMFCFLLFLFLRYLYRKTYSLLKSLSSTVTELHHRHVTAKGSLPKEARTSVRSAGRETPVRDPIYRVSISSEKSEYADQKEIKNAAGRRLIILASVAAFLSMGSEWAKVLFLAKSGVNIGMSASLLIWIYPFFAALFSLRIKKNVGIGLASLNLLVTLVAILVIANKTAFGLFSVSVGIGAWVYLLASIFLWRGISAYCSADRPSIVAGQSFEDSLVHSSQHETIK